MLGSTTYWGGFVVNGHQTESMDNVVLFLDPNTEHPEDEIAIGLESFSPTGGGYHYQPYFTANGANYDETLDAPQYQLPEFTVAAWFRTSFSYTTEGFIVNKGGMGDDLAGNNLNYGIWMDANEKIVMGFEESAPVLGADHYLVSPSTYNDGQWHFAAMRYTSANVLTAWVDMVQIGTATTAGSTVELNTKPIRIGANALVANRFFNGNIDEVRIWNRALLFAELSDLYTMGSVVQSGLVFEKLFGANVPSMQTVANINTAPTNVTFFPAPTYNQGVFIGTLQPNEGRGFWLQRILNPTREEKKRNLFDIGIGFDPRSGSSGTGSGSGSGGGGSNPPPGPAPGDFSVGIDADWGTSSGTKAAIDNISNFMEDDPTFMTVISAGDTSYQSTGDKWLSMTQSIRSGGRKIVWAPGNHDYEDGKGLVKQFQQALGLGSSTWYSVTVGNMFILVADHYKSFSSGSSQYNFLKSQMEAAKNNSSLLWKLLVFHEPLYSGKSKHGNNSGFRDIYHPLADTNKFDFFICGHNHNYQRSFPIKYNSGSPSSPTIHSSGDPNYNSPDGVIHIVCGLGGHDIQYGISNTPAHNAFQEDSYFGFLMLTVSNNGRTLTGKGYKNNHDIFDTFTINK